MRGLLQDAEKITKINLPEEVEGVFVLRYRPVRSNLIKELSIEAKDGQWVFSNNNSINMLNSTDTSTVLEINKRYQLSIFETDTVLNMYCLESITSKPLIASVQVDKIYIGSGQQCGIMCTGGIFQDINCGVVAKGNAWYLCLPNYTSYFGVYLNDKIVTKEERLKAGDIIFIDGVKIIWMNSFVKVNNPNNIVTINQSYMNLVTLDNVDNTNYKPVTEEQAAIQLYKQEEYFFHTPDLKEFVQEEKVKIDAPPSPVQNEDQGFLVTFGASFSMVSSAIVSCINLINNIQNKANPITIFSSSIMLVSMILGSLLMPRIVASWNKHNNKKKEQKRIIKYTNYIQKKDEEIKTIMAKQIQALRVSNSNVVDIAGYVMNKTRDIWSREIKDQDFLLVRCGMGNVEAKIKIDAPEEKFTLDNDQLLDLVYELTEQSRILEQVPVTFNFAKNRVSAIIDDAHYGEYFTNSIILQLAALHSAQELKFVFFVDENNNDLDLDYVKYFPHIFSDDKTRRYYATNYDDMKIISKELEDIFTERIETFRKQEDNNSGADPESDQQMNMYKRFDSYYMIITNDLLNSKNLPIFNMIFEEPSNVGFSVLYIDASLNKLPKRCNSFISLTSDSGCIIEKDLNSQTIFAPEYSPDLQMRVLTNKLSNIPLMVTDAQSSLPTSISFLEMYNVSKIEQLNITNRWKTNDPTISLATPIGVHTSGELFNLDLHEKAHGPHGLIAGSTGSGKSEFIISFILSMCVNYSPDEVQFVLIDYKGGGLAGAFENREKGTCIPHLAGTITNLDTASMNRSLVSINSELKRREQKFMDARDETGESTLDIYKYQKYYREGLVKEPISHLFIISDEFAELKAQEPDFMNELVSTARIGRSLGVHLILATQKPSGVVNDQIWSNSKFKICLKVQTAADSNEMLKKPDAASLKEAGRFYLQVGYDEYYDIGQSGWSGAKYVPTERVFKKKDDSLAFINNVGNITKSVNDLVKKEVATEQGDQLTNIVKYLNEWSKKNNYTPKRLWLDPLPENIYIGNLKAKYKYEAKPYEINPIIGEYDDPKRQKQDLLTLNLNAGSTFIYGKNGSGKEDLLQTIVYSTCINHSPKEVNFYIIDTGAGTLRAFMRYPQVGDICTLDDGQKIIDLLAMAEKEVARRKELTVEFGGNFKTYNEMNPDNKLPLMVVIINNYDIFTENYGKISELISPLYRDAPKYGVVFILTIVAVPTLRSRLRDYFENHISMALNKDDYSTIFATYKRGLEPAAFKGRGLIEMNKEVLEFQTASIYTRNEINKIIKDTADSLEKKYANEALKGLPSVPKIVNVDAFLDQVKTLDKIPLGYDAEQKVPFYYNFAKNKINIISANSFDNSLPFLDALVLEFRQLIDHGLDVQVIDFSSYFDILTVGLNCYQSNFNDILGRIITNASKLEKETVYLITGIGKLKANVDEKNMPFVNDFFKNCEANTKLHFVFIETYEELNLLKIEDWYQAVVKPDYGIWVGDGVASQSLIRFNDLTQEDRNMNNPEYSLVATGGKRTLIKHIVFKESENAEGDEDNNG